MAESQVWSGFNPEERTFAERHRLGPDAPSVWNDGPLDGPNPGHFLCYECDGNKLCPEAPHPYCNGWCEYCGGCGQFPIHPEEPWPMPPPSVCRYPRPILFNVAYVRLQYIRGRVSEESNNAR